MSRDNNFSHVSDHKGKAIGDGNIMGNIISRTLECDGMHCRTEKKSLGGILIWI